MEQFYLEKPSISRKDDVLEYMEEHQKYQSDINGAGGFDKVLDGVTYEDCLEKDFKMENKEYANSINKCPRKTFFLIRKHDNKLIGMISIRYDLTEELLQFVGHIGYGIRPTERGKGYNSYTTGYQKFLIKVASNACGYPYRHKLLVEGSAPKPP